ncbi:hypothetical protein K8R33_02405 [archaeon]|nr:hypothetical protein [archaeon]
MNKRGISPLIATVLIIGFTIVLAVLVITWISGTVEDVTDDTDVLVDLNNKCLDLVGKVDVDASYDGGTTDTTVKVTNKCGQDFGFMVLWLDSSGAIDATATDNVPSIGAYGFWTDSNSAEYTTVKVIPYFGSSDNSCSEGFEEEVVGSSGPVLSCPNGVCESWLGETCANCIADCELKTDGCTVMDYVCSPYDSHGALNPMCTLSCNGGLGWCSAGPDCPPSGYDVDGTASNTECVPNGFGECCIPL